MTKSTPIAEDAECPARLHRTYNARIRLGCICPAGKVAASRYYKRQRCGLLPARMTDGAGTRRRVQGLAAAGFSARMVAAMAGRSCVRVKLLYLPGHTEQVTIEVAAAIRAATAVLAAQPPPDGTYADRVRRYAEKAGWWPLDAWFDVDTDPEPTTADEITVMHAAAGYYSWARLDDVDRGISVCGLVARGLSDTVMAELLHTTSSTISRTRRRLGLAPNLHERRRA